MPPNQEVATADAQANGTPQITEAVVAQMIQFVGANSYNPTKEQVDKMLQLQEKSMDYLHKDNHTFLPKDILRYGAFAFIVLVVVGIFVFSAFYAKEYMAQIVSAIAGFIAGGASGYGLGSSGKKKRTSDE